MEDFKIRLEKESQEDIQSFVEQKLRLTADTAKEVNEFKRTLVREANGLFLWLVLIIPQIHEMSAKGLSLKRISSEILEGSQELEDLYDGLLKRIQDSELVEAVGLFRLVCFADRPLTIDEQRIAFKIHLSGSKQSLREYEDRKNPQFVTKGKQMAKRMIHLSRGLIDTTSAKATEGETVVGFHHDTIRGFMLKKGLRDLDERLHDHRNIPESANVQLANICLLYLSTSEIRAACLEQELSKRFSFLGYAGTCWLRHASQQKEKASEKMYPGQQTQSLTATEKTTLMHIAAEYDLETLMKRILRKNRERISVNFSGHQDQVINSLLLSLLTWFVSLFTGFSIFGLGVLINFMLLVTGIVDYRQGRLIGGPMDKRGRRMELARRGVENKVRERFEEGKEERNKVMVNIRNVNGELPLHLAAKHGSLAMIEHLYKARSDVEGPDYGERKVSDNGARDDLPQGIKYVFEHGTDDDIHSTTNQGWTPLSAASDSGHIDVIRFLYEHGAHSDIHTTENDAWTPSFAASDAGIV
ncbi:hypothetical protein N7493_011492 [Penicillium malachiteum]|uniref:Uncharacterized protein n=1 Tax=Penicillium malachiteum TaxID=1324776 RepID=A0AAD6MQL9_9EURO|nr:hypothetical protein N7493_011492 [Penicillium malachiteum]